MSEQDLLPCPFCGSKADIDEFLNKKLGDHVYFSVSCNNDHENCEIGFRDHGQFARRSDAVKAWNRRAVSMPTDLRELSIKVNSLMIPVSGIIEAADTPTGAGIATGYNKAVADCLRVIHSMMNSDKGAGLSE